MILPPVSDNLSPGAFYRSTISWRYSSKGLSNLREASLLIFIPAGHNIEGTARKTFDTIFQAEMGYPPFDEVMLFGLVSDNAHLFAGIDMIVFDVCLTTEIGKHDKIQWRYMNDGNVIEEAEY